jgi:hypothetical protein
MNSYYNAEIKEKTLARDGSRERERDESCLS